MDLPPHFSFTSFENNIESLIEALELRSYVVITLNPESCLWNEHLIKRAFQVTLIEKVSAGIFRTQEGLTVGYKQEEGREFFETRMKAGGGVEPSLPVDGYDDMVIATCAQLSSIGSRVLATLCRHLAIDEHCLLDLVDESHPPSRPLASSALRVCSYPSDSLEPVAFGAHTDTSFLTIAPLSSVEGLEVFDNSNSEWVRLELAFSRSSAVVVMVGECLQLLLRQRVRACIHRVMRPLVGTRYSCPFIMRGRRDAIIDWQKHQSSIDSHRHVLADLEGVSLETVHTMLDIKRKKCAKRSPAKGDWVLAAFPTSPLAVMGESIEG